MDSEKHNMDAFFNLLRKKEYSRLDKEDHVYLDYTGGNIHPQCLADKHYRHLQNGVYGNPHSTNDASLLSEDFITKTRARVLDFFNASDYHCIFTHNASAALQIVGECYPFSPESYFLLTVDNHNSVNGISEYCRNKGGKYSYCPINYDDLSINEPELKKQLREHAGIKNKLFAFPAQSNASGALHSLAWVRKAQEQGWDVLLDAAAFVPTSKLDLTRTDPDFVSVSFYKIFGYPTGIGCLLVKKPKFNKLKKPWFAGGTVSLASVNYDSHLLMDNHEKFENGTVNYLDIPAIANGLDFIANIGLENINSRIIALCEFFLRNLANLRHDNDLPLIKIYGPKGTKNRGGNFLMNFFDCQGNQYPPRYIEQQANREMISLRTGCFCNPGIDELNNHLSSTQLESFFTGRGNANYDDMTHFFGKLRGAIRISFGIPTTESDINKFFGFARNLVNRKISEMALLELSCDAITI